MQVQQGLCPNPREKAIYGLFRPIHTFGLLIWPYEPTVHATFHKPPSFFNFSTNLRYVHFGHYVRYAHLCLRGLRYGWPINTLLRPICVCHTLWPKCVYAIGPQVATNSLCLHARPMPMAYGLTWPYRPLHRPLDYRPSVWPAIWP